MRDQRATRRLAARPCASWRPAPAPARRRTSRRSRCRPGSSWSAGDRGTRAGPRRDDVLDLRVGQLGAELAEQSLDRIAEHARRRAGDGVHRLARAHAGSSGWRAGTACRAAGTRRRGRARCVRDACGTSRTRSPSAAPPPTGCRPTVVPTSATVGSRRKYFTSRMRDVLSARSSMRPSRQKCQPSLWVIVASVTPAKSWLAILTDANRLLRVAQALPRARGSGGIDHQVELVELLPHLRRDDLAHRAGVLAGRRAGTSRIELTFSGSNVRNWMTFRCGRRAVAFREHRRVAGGVHQRLPLLCGTDRQVEHQVEVDVDEARDVLRALDVAAHPVDRIGHAAQHCDCAPVRCDIAMSMSGSQTRILGEHPRVLAAAALRRVDDERPFLERDAREAAGQHEDVLAVEDVRPQVDMPSLERAVHDRRHARQRQRRLRDVVARVRFDPPRRTPSCSSSVELRADEHAVAAGLVGRLHDQRRADCARTCWRSASSAQM